MGRIGPQPSDFECLIKGKQFEIEVKSTKAKNTIPYKNFSQLGMLRRRDMCGANVIILIYRAKHGVWCRPDFSVMLETYDPENKASWNIDGCTSYLRVAEILTEALGLGHLLKQE
jgi:penicillin-binding protein-related factor A (putative recombinase)